MKKRITLGVMFAALFSSHAMAVKSQHSCDNLIFDGVSKGGKAEFIVCESGDSVALTLINIDEDVLAEDIKIPKSSARLVTKDGATHFMAMRGALASDGGYSYSEANINGSPFRVLIVHPKDGERIVVEMQTPKVSHFDTSIIARGIGIDER